MIRSDILILAYYYRIAVSKQMRAFEADFDSSFTSQNT